MGPLAVELLDEVVEAGLLLQEIGVKLAFVSARFFNIAREKRCRPKA